MNDRARQARSRRDEAARKLNEALDLYTVGEEMMRQKIRRQNPQATEEEIERRIVEWLQRKAID